MLELSLEQQALFSLIKTALGKQEKAEYSEKTDWQAVRLESFKQAVFLLTFDAVKRSALSDEVKALWNRAEGNAVFNNINSFYSVSEMDRVMRKNNFRYVVLKGIAAAYYYPYYFLRALGDVDFLIDSKYRSEVENALEADGYRKRDTNHICHVVFKKPGQNLEMHFDVPGIPYGIQGDYVREYMNGVLDDSINFEVDGSVFELPHPKYHGLILLLHMEKHMLSEGIGLRHLIDFICFVDKTAGDKFWNTDLLPLLKKIGLYKYTQVMTKIGAMYFGTHCPDWAVDAEEELCDAVMQDILDGGNFGRKNSVRAESGVMISHSGKDGTRHSKIYNLWRAFQSSVREHFPIVKKHPLLYPICDVAIILRWIWLVLVGKRHSVILKFIYADERKSVYDRLEVFKI